MHAGRRYSLKEFIYGQAEIFMCLPALAKLVNNEIVEGTATELDYQINSIEQIFYKQKERILNAANQLMEATDVMYEAIDERIQLLVSKTKYNCKYVILMGAILINGDFDMGSFSSCKRLDVIDLETKEVKSLRENFVV